MTFELEHQRNKRNFRTVLMTLLTLLLTATAASAQYLAGPGFLYDPGLSSLPPPIEEPAPPPPEEEPPVVEAPAPPPEPQDLFIQCGHDVDSVVVSRTAVCSAPDACEDHIVINHSACPTCPATTTMYPVNTVASLTFDLGGGNDIFNSMNADFPVKVWGGWHNDIIFGGHAGDILAGNRDDDLLFGVPGARVDGGDGSDMLRAIFTSEIPSNQISIETVSLFDSPVTLNWTERLMPGSSMTSANGRFKLSVEANGSLSTAEKIDGSWVAGPGTHNGDAGGLWLKLREGGNLVQVGPGWTELWSSQTYGQGGGELAQLVLEDNGDLVLYNNEGVEYWSKLFDAPF